MIASATRVRRWPVPLTVLDQGVSSLTNLLVSFAAARYLPARAFGIFSLAFLCYVIVLGVTRGLTSEPLVIRHSATDVIEQQRAFEDVLGSTVVIAFAALVVFGGAAALMPNDLRAAMVALAVVLPGLLVQDTMRFIAASSGRTSDALRNDLTWLTCTTVAVSFVILLGRPHVAVLLLAWGGGAAVGGVLSSARLTVRPRTAHVAHWLHTHWDLGGRYAGEFLALYGSAHVSFYVVAAVGSIRDVAALQGAHMLFGPFNVMVMGLRQLSVPGLARTHARAPERFEPALVAISALATTAAVFIGIVVLIMPDVIGRHVLGATWTGASTVVVPVMLHKAAIGIGLGSLCALRVLAAASESLRSQLATGAAFVVAGPVGALLAGAVGAAWGMAGAQMFGSALYVVSVRQVAAARSDAVPPLVTRDG